MFGSLDRIIEVRLLPPLITNLERGALVQLGIKLWQLIASNPIPVFLSHEVDDFPHCECASNLHQRAT